MSSKHEKLVTLLKELFQIDQPDLDFGIYRVLHAKRAEVTQFLDKDLLPQIKDAFGQYKSADRSELVKKLADMRTAVEAAGMNPEESPKVKELEDQIANESVDIAKLESEVYDHLYSFFRRYYSEGDFLSKRVYKEGVYAIPYEGEEVKLYWANHDQYYIKTSEYLRDFAFRLNPFADEEKGEDPMRVHFRLADAAEGEHGNVKESDASKRVFVLSGGENWIFEENGELVIRFEYRPATLTDWPEDEREGKKKPPAQKDLHEIAERRIGRVQAANLLKWIKELQKPHIKADGTESEKSKIRVNLERYTARNTFDYFIHKDLGGFLRRELDFYIKNEVMHLDDIENDTAPRVEQYLSKIKVIRSIAHKIIDFLAQLEDFQKKLWLKKKFVVETSYLIRVGIIPEEFYPEIAANAAQWAEWESLHHLPELKKDDDGLFAKTVKLKSPEFLKASPSLMIDTRHFDADFTARLLDALGDLDEKTDGVLFHSENFQALNLIKARYRERVKCMYIDPPYNTGTDDFVYRDNYQYSSWATMLAERIALGHFITRPTAAFLTSIDDTSIDLLRTIYQSIYGRQGFVGSFVWRRRVTSSLAKSWVSTDHEYVLAFSRDPERVEIAGLERDQTKYNIPDGKGGFYASMPLTVGMNRNQRPNQWYELKNPKTGTGYWPPQNRVWGFYPPTMEQKIAEERIIWPEDYPDREMKTPRYKAYSEDAKRDRKPVSTWIAERGKITEMNNGEDNGFVLEVGKNEEGTRILKSFLGDIPVIFPKPVSLLQGLFQQFLGENGDVLDFFAGSGTTGHAVINLNREDGGRRKVILVEMADYFDTVLLPRLKKVAFTPEWKDGKPKRFCTPEEAERSPRIMKVIRLESYEDALNNLELKRTDAQGSLLSLAESQGPDGFREQYILRYMLDVESRGSQSLLNIQAFTDPTAYKLKVKRPGSDESRLVNVDLIETFNWLIGLTVGHFAAPQTFTAEFERDTEGRLRLAGRLRQANMETRRQGDAGNISPSPGLSVSPSQFWFRTVTGTVPDGRKTLVIWRKLTGNPEEDNLVLDEWFTRQGYSSRDSEFDLIYVNGDNNLENLRTPEDTWKVRLIEEDFHRLMFDTEDV